MHTLLQDVGYAFRLARRAPKTSFTVILTIALAVGASTTIFSVVNAVLLRELPFRDPDRLVMAQRLHPQGTPGRATYADFADWRHRSTVFDDLAAARSEACDLVSASSAVQIFASVVTSNFFSLLNVAPLVGRSFQLDDEDPGNERVAVLAEHAWRNYFGGDPQIVGKRVRLVNRDEAAEYQIVGVVSSGARLHQLPAPAVFLPQPRTPRSKAVKDPGAVYLVIGRLRQGVQRVHARIELTRLIREGGPASHLPSGGGAVVSLHEAEFGQTRRGLLTLGAGVAFVMLIACANIAALLLAQGARRNRELAVRTVAGASRFRLLTQVLVEHLLLVILGGVAGAFAAMAGVRLVLAVTPPDLPRLADVGVDRAALIFAAAAAGLSGLLSGLIPAALLSKVDLATALKAGGIHATPSSQWRDLLAALQLGLVLAMLVGAVLAITSLWKLVRVDLGFSTKGILAAELAIPPHYGVTRERQFAFQRELLQRTAELSEVDVTALSTELPPARVVGGMYLPNGELVRPLFRYVTADYFQILRIPIIRGRTFTAIEEEPSLVVNQAFKEQFFAGKQNIVGVRIPAAGKVIGIVGNTWEGSPTLSPQPMVYKNVAETRMSRLLLLMRTRDSKVAALAQFRRVVREIDPELATQVSSLDEHVAGTRRQLRFYAMVLGGFAAFGLLIAGLGVFTVVQQAATERARELAIRIAIGASPSAIRCLVLKRLAIFGSAAAAGGIWLGIVTSRGLRSVLFDITETNLASLFTAATILLLVAFTAIRGPLKRAVSLDPVVALREP